MRISPLSPRRSPRPATPWTASSTGWFKIWRSAPQAGCVQRLEARTCTAAKERLLPQPRPSRHAVSFARRPTRFKGPGALRRVALGHRHRQHRLAHLEDWELPEAWIRSMSCSVHRHSRRSSSPRRPMLQEHPKRACAISSIQFRPRCAEDIREHSAEFPRSGWELVGAQSTDLARFREHGGKLHRPARRLRSHLFNQRHPRLVAQGRCGKSRRGCRVSYEFLRCPA